jgi:hemerythrin-like domain-containing protein
MEEHRVIERVLDCLERMADLGQKDGRIEAQPAREAVDFLRNFADKRHHGKEEERLFPVLEAGGFSPDSGPTGVMRVEHVQGRELVGRVDTSIEGAAAGQREDVETFVQAARAFVTLLRDHIQKEDHCLFPMADQALSPDAQEQLLKSFSDADGRESGGKDYHMLAAALSERFGRDS